MQEYPRETFTVDVPIGRGDNVCTILGRPAPKNLGGQKIVQNWARFLTTFDFDREYLSGTDQSITNRESSWTSTTPSTLDDKKLVYFVPQNVKVIDSNVFRLQLTFFGYYVSALKGCCPPQIFHALQIDLGCLRTPNGPTRTGVPRKKA